MNPDENAIGKKPLKSITLGDIQINAIFLYLRIYSYLEKNILLIKIFINFHHKPSFDSYE